MLQNSLPIVIWQGIRPPTLLLGFAPVILGTVLGGYFDSSTKVNSLVVILTLLFVGSLQAAANLINDAKDAESGVDSDNRVGPVRVVASGMLPLKQAKIVYSLLLGLGMTVGLGLAIYGGWTLTIMAAVCCLAAYAYTGGPFPLSHYALGEATAFLFFGPVAVLGTAFLHSHRWQYDDLLISLGPGFLAAAVMAINNVRDMDTDRQSTKRTLPLLLPDSISRALPWFFICAGIFVAVIFGLTAEALWYYTVPSVTLFILARCFIHPNLIPEGGRMNIALKRCSLFVFLYCCTFALLIGIL
ncbi:MAG: 1,4-dihydroxy-2-naphthoate octaprenyltransferase [Pseudobacteriovorax sp.]|nr:1,4-dihydroxy-2-naphthoate octaprenyltransferase [Pseudobacteriovorax sp.]